MGLVAEKVKERRNTLIFLQLCVRHPPVQVKRSHRLRLRRTSNISQIEVHTCCATAVEGRHAFHDAEGSNQPMSISCSLSPIPIFCPTSPSGKKKPQSWGRKGSGTRGAIKEPGTFSFVRLNGASRETRKRGRPKPIRKSVQVMGSFGRKNEGAL